MSDDLVIGLRQLRRQIHSMNNSHDERLGCCGCC